MRISDWSSDVCSSYLLEVLTQGAFRPEPGPPQQPLARRILVEAGGLQPVQPHRTEAMRHHQRQRLGHISLAGMRRAGPVTKLTALRGAAPDIRQRDAAEQGEIGRAHV